MAERNFDFLETIGRKKRLVAGSFTPNGTGTIDNSLNKGQFTVEYSATGVYTIQLPDKYGTALHVACSLVQASHAQYVEVASVDAAAGTIVLNSFTEGGVSAAEVAAAAGTSISFVAVFDDALTV
jgi:hypothetical protein